MWLIIIVAAKHFKTDITHEFPVTFKYDVHIETWRPIPVYSSSVPTSLIQTVSIQTEGFVQNLKHHSGNIYLSKKLLFTTTGTFPLCSHKLSLSVIRLVYPPQEEIHRKLKMRSETPALNFRLPRAKNKQRNKPKKETNKKKKAKHLVKENTFSAES